MSDALAGCDRVLALFSRAYFERPRCTTDEWTVALVHVPGTEQGRLVPARVENMPGKDMPAVLRPLIFCDLVGLGAGEARQALLDTVQGPRRPDGEPAFPGSGTPAGLRRLEGSVPRLPSYLLARGDTRAAYDAESRSSWSTSWRRLLQLRYPIARKTGLLPGQARVVRAV